MTKILQPITSTWLDYPNKDDCCLVVVMMDARVAKVEDKLTKLVQKYAIDNETKDYDVDSLIEELKMLCERHRTNKIVLSGGDPLSCFNIKFTKEFLEKAPFDVCIYTGHTIDYVKLHKVSGFKYLKCGMYLKNESQVSEKTDTYMQFASKNQKLFDSNYCCLSQNGLYYF